MPCFDLYSIFFTITLYIQYQSLKLLNMKLDENILKACKGLVMNCNCKVLILDVLGEHRVFLVNDVHLKTRDLNR